MKWKTSGLTRILLRTRCLDRRVKCDPEPQWWHWAPEVLRGGSQPSPPSFQLQKTPESTQNLIHCSGPEPGWLRWLGCSWGQNSNICGNAWKCPKADGLIQLDSQNIDKSRLAKLPEVLQRGTRSFYRALITFCWLESIKSVGWVFYSAQKWREQDQNSWNRNDSCNSWEVWGPRAVVSRCPIQATCRNIQKQKFDSNFMWVMEVGSQAEGLFIHR